jgi:hypothetical protein
MLSEICTSASRELESSLMFRSKPQTNVSPLALERSHSIVDCNVKIVDLRNKSRTIFTTDATERICKGYL